LNNIRKDTRRIKIYQKAGREVKAAMEKYLYSKEYGRFLKTIIPRENGSFDIDPTLDASVMSY
jgi:GH15 family glucan-1,4-alpha-glucosidase